jgi:acetyl-CoA decarbonylase/synthase complex subunit delta
MGFELPKESWSSAVNTVTLGGTAESGGTRTSTVTIGGETTTPFLHFEGATPNRPALAMEVLDQEPTNWPPVLAEPFAGVLGEPAAWAKKCVEEFGAEMICLRLVSADPNTGADAPPEKCVETVKAVLGAVGVPLVIWGCGNAEKDNQIMPAVSQAAAGECCLLGSAVEDNYKTITASCIADGHKLITEAPLDINIQKQVNILVTDMGLSADNLVMYQVTGGLGYGMEYAYSIMERTRLAALSGDKMLSMPMLAVVGSEVWKAKEARLTAADAPEWGDETKRGPLWEAATAISFLLAGTDLLVMWHPEAVRLVRESLDQLMGGNDA